MKMSEDSIDTVRIDQGVRKKTVSDSLKIGIADDGDYLQRQLLAIHEELRKRLNNTPYTHIQRNLQSSSDRQDYSHAQYADRVPLQPSVCL